MAIRTAHGKGARKAICRVETLPVDELPTVPDSAAVVAAERARGAEAARSLAAGGDATAARELGRRGGLAKAARAAKLRALQSLGLDPALVSPDLLPYLDRAEEWAEAEVARLAAHVGRGHTPPNVCVLIHSAALNLAASRLAFSRGELALASRLAAEMRQHVLAAHELTAKEAKSRPSELEGMTPAQATIARLFPGKRAQ